MTWTSLFIHVLNYFLPVVFMTLCMVIGRWIRGRPRGAGPWWLWAYGLGLLLMGAVVDLGVLWMTGQEGSLLGYGLVCLAMALFNWLWSHPWRQKH